MVQASEAPVLVLRPTSGWRAVDLRELWRFRDLLFTLAGRDVKLRYRQTALGVIWVVLQPLVAAGIFSFVFGRVADLPSEGAPYIVFAFAGMLCWNLFQTTLGKSSSSLVGNAGMMTKIYFPRIALPTAMIFGALLDFGVGLAMMMVVAAVEGALPNWTIVFLPVWMIMTLMLSLGIGLFAGALMVSYRDVGQALPVMSQMLLYISPVAYSLTAVPDNLRWAFSLNPMVGILEGFRWSLVSGGGALRPGYILYSAVVAIVVLAAGALTFSRMERRFADVV